MSSAARDEMAALLSPSSGPAFQGVDKWYLDAIARLATDPATAPVVFRWLVEAGVLVQFPRIGNAYYQATALAGTPDPCPVVVGQQQGIGPGLFITCGKPHFVADHEDEGE